ALLAPYVMGGGDGRVFRAPYLGPPYYQEMVGYVGVLTIMLVLIAVLVKSEARTKFWVVVGILGFFLAFGSYAPLESYRLIYYVPILNLFRVPARHLREVDFALAVLAGIGLTRLTEFRGASETKLKVGIIAAVIVIFTILTVTWLRPANFQLSREAPISLLPAPELFLPILISLMSAVALWISVSEKRAASVLMFVVLLVDLVLWGHSTGWVVGSPRRNAEYWRRPEVVTSLNSLMGSNP